MNFKSIEFTAQIISDVQNKGTNPLIMNSGKKISTNQIRNILINRVAIPKVIILIGVVINFSMGFIKKLTSPRTAPTKIKISQTEVSSIPKKLDCPGTTIKLTPDMNLTARNIPKIPAIICRIKRFTVYTLAKYDYLGKTNSLFLDYIKVL